MKIRGFEVIALESAQTLFHYTERYRYTTEISRYTLRGYMIVNRVTPIHAGTVYKTPEDALEGLWEMQDWLQRYGKYRQADELVVVPQDFTESVWKKRAYKLK